MLKLLRLLSITLFTISIFNISSITIVEENSSSQVEKSMQESMPENETIDKFLNEFSFYKLAYRVDTFQNIHIRATKNFSYQHSLLRPPISS